MEKNKPKGKKLKVYIENNYFSKENILTYAINSLSDSFAIIDVKDQSLVYSNKINLSNKTKKIFCYNTCHGNGFPCSNNDNASCALKEIKKTKKPTVINHVHNGRGSNSSSVEIHCYPIFNEKNKLSYIAEIALDVTENKKQKAILEDRENELNRIIDFNQKILESSPVGMFVLGSMV